MTYDSLYEIWSTITHNKVRSILTGFGVFWGISMLIVLLGIGNSFEGGLMNSLSGIPRNSCFFWAENTTISYRGFLKNRSWEMNNKDVNLIKANSQSLEVISPVLFGENETNNVIRGGISGTFDVKGVDYAHFIIEPALVIDGRLINEIDIKYNRKVCLVGRNVQLMYFAKDENPIGQYIRVSGIYYQIVGIIDSQSKISVGGRISDSVFLPISTMQQTNGKDGVIHSLSCTVKRGYPVTFLQEEIKSIIRTSHQISPKDDKAIGSINMEHQYRKYRDLFYAVHLFIWIVGIGSLFSGIIGITNIMLVTVKERTNEIGIRRAVGATSLRIISQILLESLILTFIAGLSGIILGYSILEVIRQMMQTDVGEELMFIAPFISITSVIMSLLLLILGGLLAGFIPSTRATKIKVVDAIRYI